MKDKLSLIASLVAIVAVCFGAYFYIEGRYALCQDLKQTQQRLDYKIVSDQFMEISKRIWVIKERHGENPKEVTIKEELRKLEEEKEATKEQLKKMEKK